MDKRPLIETALGATGRIRLRRVKTPRRIYHSAIGVGPVSIPATHYQLLPSHIACLMICATTGSVAPGQQLSTEADSMNGRYVKTMRPTLFTLPALIALAVAPLATAQVEPTRGFYNVTTFGASSDGQTICTKAIDQAIDAAVSHGGGTVYFPSGTYLTGPIRLQSHITLFLDAGATIKFSTNFDDYLPMVPSRWEGITVTNFSPLISAYQASDVAIVGRGTLDGQGKAWWDFLHKLRAEQGLTPQQVAGGICPPEQGHYRRDELRPAQCRLSPSAVHPVV